MSDKENIQRFAIVPRQAAEDDTLSDTVFRTLTILASYNDDEGWCYPSYNTIAKRRGLTRRTVIRHIEELVSKGYVVKQSRMNEKGEQTSNKYYTVLDYGKGCLSVTLDSTKHSHRAFHKPAHYLVHLVHACHVHRGAVPKHPFLQACSYVKRIR